MFRHFRLKPPISENICDLFILNWIFHMLVIARNIIEIL